MKQLKPFYRALVVGCCVELALVVCTLVFGLWGPCMPKDILTFILFALHLPGLLLSAPLTSVENVRPGTEWVRDSMSLIIVVVTGALTWTGLAYVWIRGDRKSVV